MATVAEETEQLELPEVQDVAADQADAQPEATAEGAAPTPDATAQPAAETKPVDDVADLRSLRDWEVRLAEAEQEVASREGTVNSLKIDLKEAKESLDEAINDMRFVIRERTRRYPLFDQAKPVEITKPAKEAPAVDPHAWRAEPITVLDLGESIETKLNDAGIKLLGELEDLRADEFKGLKSIKGIGQAKADVIEEKILDWLSRNRDSGALKVEGSPDAAAKALQDRATFLANTGGSLDLTPADDANWHESGRTAYGNGDDLTECPCIAGAEQDSWLRGWMYGEENDPDAHESEPEEEPSA